MASLGYIASSQTFDNIEITGEVKSSGSTVATANVGTASNSTAAEFGDGVHHKTVLTLSSTAIISVAGGAAEAGGIKIYDFPASSAIHINSVYANLTMTLNTGTDTPDVGLGTVVATGAVSVLDGTTTFEDVLTGEAYNAGVVDKTVATVSLAKAGTTSVYLNAADTWVASAVDATFTGTITIHWTYLGSTA